MSVPRTLEQALSPEWLTGALSGRFPGIEISRVDRGPVIDRVATNALFELTCVDQPSELPSRLCVKGYFSEAGQAFRHAGEPEARFYQDISGQSGVRTLRPLYAEIDPDTRASVIITEDVLAQGARFLDATSAYTPDQVAESLTQFAGLHAATWESERLREQDWLTSRLGTYLVLRGVDDVRHNFDGPIGAGVPEAARDAERLVAAYRELADRVATSRPWTVVHGDAHIGNVFLDRDGRPCITDWQLAQRGPWWLDVGYHIASALPVSERRRTEADLVRHYLDELSGHGIEIESADDIRLGIRLGIVHGFFLWAITRHVDPKITSTLLERLGAAAADHDALAALVP